MSLLVVFNRRLERFYRKFDFHQVKLRLRIDTSEKNFEFWRQCLCRQQKFATVKSNHSSWKTRALILLLLYEI